jgi:hypothetical protein
MIWDALSGLNDDLSLLITLEARLNILSDGADVAGMQSRILASSLIIGKSALLYFHQINGFLYSFVVVLMKILAAGLAR